ncbi:MAG: hypothetical protein IJJ69_03120 [Oscillospiraceae bacterium]|nr:hypothetical protein [Oscillospiraceae bacterium]
MKEKYCTACPDCGGTQLADFPAFDTESVWEEPTKYYRCKNSRCRSVFYWGIYSGTLHHYQCRGLKKRLTQAIA